MLRTENGAQPILHASAKTAWRVYLNILLLNNREALEGSNDAPRGDPGVEKRRAAKNARVNVHHAAPADGGRASIAQVAHLHGLRKPENSTLLKRVRALVRCQPISTYALWIALQRISHYRLASGF